jgi:transposase
MFGFSSHLRYYLCCTHVDMRNGFDGLAGIVRNKLKKDPISGDVFIFVNKQQTHIKILYWDGNGFALFYKRLEAGRYASTT